MFHPRTSASVSPMRCATRPRLQWRLTTGPESVECTAHEQLAPCAFVGIIACGPICSMRLLGAERERAHLFSSGVPRERRPLSTEPLDRRVGDGDQMERVDTLGWTIEEGLRLPDGGLVPLGIEVLFAWVLLVVGRAFSHEEAEADVRYVVPVRVAELGQKAGVETQMEAPQVLLAVDRCQEEPVVG